MAEQRGFSGSYATNDVTFLLKPVLLEWTDVATKEALIQSGRRHYSEMLSPETVPDAVYFDLYRNALKRHRDRLAQDIASLAAALDAHAEHGAEIVLVSLVRAGTPIGVLLLRALERLGRTASHYSISIIRDRGIDAAALDYIANRHDPRHIVFVDGWTGKGAIVGELRSSLHDNRWGIDPELVVVADPAGKADMAAGYEDYLIPSGLLNSIVSGLVSRSILNDEVVGEGEFHACMKFDHLAPYDVSQSFVDEIDTLAINAMPHPIANPADASTVCTACDTMVDKIMRDYGIANRNLVKPGIAEATRAVLRRVPQRILVRDRADSDIAHLMYLADQKGVPVEIFPDAGHYRAIAVVQALGPNDMTGPNP